MHASLLSPRKTETFEPAFVAYSCTVTIITIILLMLQLILDRLFVQLPGLRVNNYLK